MAKRYHYDSKGRLKGYSTNKYQPRLRDLLYGGIAIIIGSYLFPSKTNKDAAPSAVESVEDGGRIRERALPLAKERTNADVDRELRMDTERQCDQGDLNSCSQLGRASPDQLRNEQSGTQNEEPAKTDYERDLKPYYEKQCARGEESACQALRVGDGGVE